MNNIKAIKEKIIELKRNGNKPKVDFDQSWITERFVENTISYTEDVGFLLCDKQIRTKNNGEEYDINGGNSVTNSQIRNFFGEVKRIQLKVSSNHEKWNSVNSSFLLLKPKLNYMSARVTGKNSNSRITILKEALEKALDSIMVQPNYESTVEQYNRFSEFLEAILAYHKSFGGKE